jgi:hypothetical protein
MDKAGREKPQPPVPVDGTQSDERKQGMGSVRERIREMERLAGLVKDETSHARAESILLAPVVSVSGCVQTGDLDTRGDVGVSGSAVRSENKEGTESTEGVKSREDTQGRELTPPALVFDLTPGREPSPARYKHGEPLQLGEFALMSVVVCN